MPKAHARFVPGKLVVVMYYRADLLDSDRMIPDGWSLTRGDDLGIVHERANGQAIHHGKSHYKLFHGVHPKFVTAVLSFTHEVIRVGI